MHCFYMFSVFFQSFVCFSHVYAHWTLFLVFFSMIMTMDILGQCFVGLKSSIWLLSCSFCKCGPNFSLYAHGTGWNGAAIRGTLRSICSSTVSSFSNPIPFPKPIEYFRMLFQYVASFVFFIWRFCLLWGWS